MPACVIAHPSGTKVRLETGVFWSRYNDDLLQIILH
jgi:hypothetical protein